MIVPFDVTSVWAVCPPGEGDAGRLTMSAGKAHTGKAAVEPFGRAAGRCRLVLEDRPNKRQSMRGVQPTLRGSYHG